MICLLFTYYYWYIDQFYWSSILIDYPKHDIHRRSLYVLLCHVQLHRIQSSKQNRKQRTIRGSRHLHRTDRRPSSRHPKDDCAIIFTIDVSPGSSCSSTPRQKGKPGFNFQTRLHLKPPAPVEQTNNRDYIISNN